MSNLAGIRIAVTRPTPQAEELAEPLRALGADVLVAPLIRIAAAPVEGPLRDALLALGSYQWLVLSSVNGVELLLKAARELGVMAALQNRRIACVGPATAAAAEAAGLHVNTIPEEFVGDAIADAIAAHGDIRGERILLARAGGARNVLPLRLAELGAQVTDVELYRSVADESGAKLLRERIAARDLDVLTFTSSSAVRYFCEQAGAAGSALVAVIGPATAETAEALQMRVSIEADPHTVEGLVQAIARHFGE